MNEQRPISDWLPTTVKEAEARGWTDLDVIIFSGDAYVDHPSFGSSVIGRIIESEGLKVAIVPQPNWRDNLKDFKKFGKPNLFFAVSAGTMGRAVVSGSWRQLGSQLDHRCRAARGRSRARPPHCARRRAICDRSTRCVS